ncbi:hypothetical protein BJY04DRAFT_220064 [Aspergillus karnatakaensis]|uniref:LysM peptidoglycan-binding domain-containing protein n=1 Tax=Aspergillus karnatakaensis TaxID=1810916 RepID=UPI003CCCEFD0
MHSFTTAFVLACFAAPSVASPIIQLLNSPTPNLPYDPNTSEYCSWWWDNDGTASCPEVLDQNFISIDDFIRWNPSVTADCGNFKEGFSYCVEAFDEPSPTTTSRTTSVPTTNPTSTSTEPTSTAPPSNGIETPLPIQPGMVDNCDDFHFVERGETCTTITAAYGITLAQFTAWNPTVGSTCGGIWADAYVCVSILGHNPGSPTTTSTPPDPTAPPNGIETPLPIQPGMVDDCDAFHFVRQGETCSTITASYSITLAQFTRWNPTVGTSCGGIWANAYVCVSIVGHAPNPTTTTAPPPTTTGTGPSPTQPGIVGTCTAFYKAQAGDTCQTIAQQKYPYINLLSLFQRWNPAVGSNCNGLLTGYYYCVATELHQPMPGIISTCRRYYQVKAGDSCWSIQQQYGITAAQFSRWNPLVGSSCTSLWERYFVCIAV